MSDDGFVFGDDEPDESGLFGTRSADEADAANRETDRRFGRVDSTEARTVVERIRAATDERPLRTAATVTAALVFVAALVTVAYPLVTGAFDPTDSSSGAGATTEGGVGIASSTRSMSAPTAIGSTETEPTAPETSATNTPTTITTTASRSTDPTVTPTPTPTTTTVAPTRGFPAGDSGNETADTGA